LLPTRSQQDQRCVVQRLDDMLHRTGDIQVTWWCWYYSNIHHKEVSEKAFTSQFYLTHYIGRLCYISFISNCTFVDKTTNSFISFYDYLYIMSHVNLRLKFHPCFIKFLVLPLTKNMVDL